SNHRIDSSARSTEELNGVSFSKAWPSKPVAGGWRVVPGGVEANLVVRLTSWCIVHPAGLPSTLILTSNLRFPCAVFPLSEPPAFPPSSFPEPAVVPSKPLQASPALVTKSSLQQQNLDPVNQRRAPKNRGTAKPLASVRLTGLSPA